ncbi:MAG: hypothetical protein UR94_C0046G0011 [Parcubacteria group bacterium GW2011_GWA2_36_10]|nr:MAG: hypothetical protein UR94_C0046G0011 [Parcubacteria group bacterium GW2011_GWA2_36_10]
MEDFRHPDQKLLPKELQAWWHNFLATSPSNWSLRQEIVTAKPWKYEAAEELLRRANASDDCLRAIIEHVPECEVRAASLLAWRVRVATSHVCRPVRANKPDIVLLKWLARGEW